MLAVAVLGASGRMGRAVTRCLVDADGLRLAGAVTEAADPELGRDAGAVCGLPSLGVRLTDDPSEGLRDAQVAIDFTLPAATEAKHRRRRQAGRRPGRRHHRAGVRADGGPGGPGRGAYRSYMRAT